MADYQTALASLLQDEGGYSNDPKDPGGETFEGISRNAWPDWLGWLLVDEWTAAGRPAMNLDQMAALDRAVAAFYRGHFWDRFRGDEIASQPVADALLSCAVNLGITPAIRMLQNSAGADADGIFGPGTLSKVNQAGESLLGPFLAAWREHYKTILFAHPERERYAKGWEARVKRYEVTA